MAQLYDQFNRPIKVEKAPSRRPLATAPLYDAWREYVAAGLTPETLASVLREADGGDMRRQAELFDQIEERDGHLIGEVGKRKNAVLDVDFQVVPASEDARDARVAEFVEDYFDRMTDWEDLLASMQDAVGKGYSCHEIDWDSSSGQAVPERLTYLEQKRFLFADQDGTVRRTPLLLSDADTMGAEIPAWKVLFHAYGGKSGHPTRSGLHRISAWMYLFKNYAVKDWITFCEVYGMPLRIGKFDPGASADDKAALATAVRAIGADAAGIISKSTEIEFVEAAKGSVKGDLYEAMAGFCNKEISKAILGQTLTADVGDVGSYAAATVHNDVRIDLVKADSRAIAATIRHQLIRPMVGFNFGWDTPVPDFIAPWEEPEDLDAKAEWVGKLMDRGVKFPSSWIREEFQIPEPEEGEDVVGGAAPAASPKAEADEPTKVTAKADDPHTADLEIEQNEIDTMAAEGVADATTELSANLGGLRAWLALTPNPAEKIAQAYPMLQATALTGALAEAMWQADDMGANAVGYAALTAKAYWGEGLPFEEAIDYFRARAFVIAEVAKADLLQAVKDELARHLAEGGTLEQFRDEVDTLFIRHGYAPLQPFRVETIFKTNLQAAYQAGRYRQMTEPVVMAALPYWRYVAVLDGSTRPTHAAMHGKIYPAGHRFWATWYPPNGFNCRCTVVGLSARQIEANGWTVETVDPTGNLFEPIDPTRGVRLPARPLMPDEGWDRNPAEKIFTPDLSGYDPALRALVEAEIGDVLERLTNAG